MRQAHIFEEHSSVLAHWFSIGSKEATLVYLDAHLDLQFVGETRLDRLRQCQSAEDIAHLESPHPQTPSGTCCFGIEDFLLPAVRLGLIGRVVWVAPPHVLRAGFGAALAGLQQMEGITIEALESFHRVPEGWLVGNLLGVELTVCQLSDLPQMSLGGPVLLDIDADYFVSLPEDSVWIHPRQVVEALAALLDAVNDLTISRSVGTGFMPLRYRFIADHVAAIWRGDRVAADHWDQLLQLMQDVENPANSSGERVERLLQIKHENPACAATCYALALASVDGGLRSGYLAQAATLDRAYGDDLVRRLGEFQARWKQITLSTVLALQREVEALTDTQERRAIAWILLGQLYAVLGRPTEAANCDEQSLALSSGNSDLALSIATMQIGRGNFVMAVPLLERAVADDETRVGAWVQVAESALAQHDSKRALEHAQMACRVAPAWLHLRKRLVGYADGAELAARFKQEHDVLQARLLAIAARLRS